jgi:glycosyltransferase involved in cell wall biosynthesis
LREHFEKRAASPELKGRVIFAGLVPPAQVPEYLSASDVVVHLSYREGLPRALSQSLASAIPVVAYDCDGSSEVCLDGRTGFLVAQKDLATLTDRIARLAADADLRPRFGKAGRDFVRENFAVETMVDQIFALYQRLLAPQ